MTHQNENPGARGGATGAEHSTRKTSRSSYRGGSQFANTSGTPSHIWLETPQAKFLVKGRNAWALLRLMERGERGVTLVEEPTGPRWSAYVFKLKKQGFEIETITETHGGAYPGHLGRYVLHTPCALVEV